MMHGHYAWSLLGYVIPVVVMVCMSSAFQLACIRALSRRSETLNQCSKTLSHRQRSVLRCAATLVLPLCCQTPLLLLHVASIFGIEFSPHVTFGSTVTTLQFSSVVNAILSVVITPAFISYVFSRETSHLKQKLLGYQKKAM